MLTQRIAQFSGVRPTLSRRTRGASERRDTVLGRYDATEATYVTTAPGPRQLT